jgi:hypothetical protein
VLLSSLVIVMGGMISATCSAFVQGVAVLESVGKLRKLYKEYYPTIPLEDDIQEGEMVIIEMGGLDIDVL